MSNVSNETFYKQERKALDILLNNLNQDGSRWDLYGVNKEDHCNWKVIKCVDCRITGISLSFQKLQGFISPEINQLLKLTSLNLDRNSITGTIPKEIGDLDMLEYLDLSENELEGSIPDEFSNLLNLKRLKLYSNSVGGSIPKKLGDCLNLLELSLYEKFLTGTIPEKIGSLTSLTFMKLERNLLSGNIPKEIGSLINLVDLNLSSNFLTGSIPTNIGRLSKIVNLNLMENSLQGNIPREVWSLSNLVVLDLNYNNFTGSISKQIQRLAKLRELYLGSNPLLGGAIPEEIGALVNLEYLWLDFCNLAGSMPTKIWSLSKLVELKVTNNTLKGIIPKKIGNFKSLTTLHLGLNNFEGTIPEEIEELSELNYLHLNENDFTGSIPNTIGKLFNMKELNFGNNSMTGTIPMNIGALTSLKEMILQGNSFSGTIPKEIDGLKNLTLLNLSTNNLLGPVPSNLFQDLISAEMINFSRNKLIGPFFSFNGNAQRTRLRKLYLDHNYMSGTLPFFLSDVMPRLEILNLANNVEKRRNDQKCFMLSKCSGFNSLDSISGSTLVCCGDRVCSTKFYENGMEICLFGMGLRGPIPADISNLLYLIKADFSRNSLSGTVPEDLGLLSRIQYLYLSDNKLTGTLPSKIALMGNGKTIIRLNGNRFEEKLAPLSLCQLETSIDISRVEVMCPLERNALSFFFKDTKGSSWTDSTGWDTEQNYCEWRYVTCNDDKKITRIELSGKGLSGSISAYIGNLTSLETLDLSNNEIKGTLPEVLGKLKNLQFLRLSYNAFTGTVPDTFANLTNLTVFQLNSNQITGKIENITMKNTEKKYSLVADCGYPSLFEDPVKCDECKMCCNSNDECSPTNGKYNLTSPNIILIAFIIISSAFCFLLAGISKFCFSRKVEKVEKELKDFLEKLGEGSAYIFVLGGKLKGFAVTIAVVIIQISLLALFFRALDRSSKNHVVMHSWSCPKDKATCELELEPSQLSWILFFFVMAFKLVPDIFSGIW
eukprot:CAMPEP_0194301030 /NCGR_PEP_ID=MMETSP0169-20130528/61578_1 /TAXON_ID=218684 /ORGANISM="Corethron pennatum, Strain L29A3" /LENGTH=998 /DNA_ID=CAMNT_0039051253 /DNA_START=940 /DNA_END=3933 /DNA_ORIENTATION=-